LSGWPADVRDEVLVLCGRRCCICHMFCGTKMELHHIEARAVGGSDTIENCIPLCLNCHAEVGHYNSQHPKGSKFSAKELRGHRAKWYAMMAQLSVETDFQKPTTTIYEGQLVELDGFLWQEAFPGRPNYESLDSDEREVAWMLMLPTPIRLVTLSAESGSANTSADLKRLQLVFESKYAESDMRHVRVAGSLWASHNAHHHGEAMMTVTSIEESDALGIAVRYYPSAAGVTHQPIPVIHRLDYDVARRQLINAGWQPIRNNWLHRESLFGQAAELWDRGYTEVKDCSGTGLAHCWFEFVDAFGNRLQITTAGERDPSVLGSSPSVWSWRLNPKDGDLGV
jgi:HNH endonuclease/Domain of unknown function (DUF4431)